MQYLPNWFYGLTPPGWFPDRPREPQFWALTLLNASFVGTDINRIEQVFDKKRDVLVFGGTCVVTVGNAAPPTFVAPINGSCSEVLVRMSNPAGREIYSSGTVVGSGNQPGFVPLEHIFGAWNQVARRPIFWPIPIPIPKGGSLMLELINMVLGTAKDLRFCFWSSIMYEEREVA